MIVVQFVHKSVHVREIILSKPWFREGGQTCSRTEMLTYFIFFIRLIIIQLRSMKGPAKLLFVIKIY